MMMWCWCDGGGVTAAQGEGQQRKKVYANGSWYIGSLDGKGRRHGRGAMVFKDGTYEGDWRHGKQTGVGTYVWTSGSRYQGTLRAPLRTRMRSVRVQCCRERPSPHMCPCVVCVVSCRVRRVWWYSSCSACRGVARWPVRGQGDLYVA
jgi:hypothetical protein